MGEMGWGREGEEEEEDLEGVIPQGPSGNSIGFWFPSQRNLFFAKSEKSFCKNTISSLELGVSFVVINYICLSFIQIHAAFYFDYINYSGLLIFCCQNVATSLL